MPLGVLEPDFAQSVVDRPGDDVHLRERAAEMRDAATASDEEGDEDDVRRVHAVVEEHPDRHESRRAGPDLQKKKRIRTALVSQEIDGAKETKRKRACASRRKTHVFTARRLSRMQAGNLAWKSRGSPVLESDCTSREPIGTSLMTRCKPNSRGPPLR